MESFVRKALLGILVVGAAGTGTELLLVRHFDRSTQFVPLVLLGAGFPLAAWVANAQTGTAFRVFRALMWVFILASIVGVVMHFLGNMAYAKDSNPSLAGAELYWEAIVGSTPVLAPGALLQLGLVGLLFTFRHPQLRGPARGGESSSPGAEP